MNFKTVLVEDPTEKVVVDFIDRGLVTLELNVSKGTLQVLVEGPEHGSQWPILLNQEVPFERREEECEGEEEETP